MRLRRVLSAIVLLASVGISGHEVAYAQQPQVSQWPEVQGRGVCWAPGGWCPINGTLPLGASCYCTIPPNTAVYGKVTDHFYRGRVNPFFNSHTLPSLNR
jgi:hypothetical protein